MTSYTPSVYAHLREEQSCQISSRSDLKRLSLRRLFEERATPRQLTITRPVFFIGPFENMGLLHEPYVYKSQRAESTPDTPSQDE